MKNDIKSFLYISRINLSIIVFLVFCFIPLNTVGQIILSEASTPMEEYAAKELQRYYYQLSGRMLTIENNNTLDSKTEFVLTTLDNPLIRNWVKSGLITISNTPQEQGYIIKTVKGRGKQTIVIAGAEPIGLLYGVYGLLEDHLGMRFYMSEDVYPEHRITGKLPSIDDERSPKMAVRGFLPWTNFPQSATVYSWNDWRFIIDQATKMRMNFMLIHNYNGFCGHNEMFHNFEYDGHLSRSWMATVKTGHGWACPPWDINEYRFGASGIYDDYDFGSDCGLHNETLTNKQIQDKGSSMFRKIIEYAHQRGVKIGLGLDIDVIPSEYQAEADNPLLVKAQTAQLIKEYPNLDYLFCFQSESRKDSVFYAKWKSIFDGFYSEIKTHMPATHIAVSGWGLTAESVANLPEDVICAPISHYSASFESGSIYGKREYWGCPWLERDFNSSQYYYPYNVHLSETIESYKNASVNMNGFYALTWRLTDAISPKMWYISKAPWYDKDRLDTSEKVYQDFAGASYGKKARKEITSIINQQEPFATDFAECVQTPKFDQMINSYPLLNISSISFTNNEKTHFNLPATNYTAKEGTQNAPCDEGGECVGYIVSGNWLKYENVDFGNSTQQIAVRIASASNGGIMTLRLDKPDGLVIARFDVRNTEGWQAWKTLSSPISPIKGKHTLFVYFEDYDTIANAVQVAKNQLGIIDKCIGNTSDSAYKKRLTHLRKRIEAVGYHIDLNTNFESYKWEDFPGKLDDWARSFLYRIDDISSFGNVMSTQNRFIQENYISKIESLRKQQRVKAPSHIVAKGTKQGAWVTWRNEDPATGYFVVCRNQEEIARVDANKTEYYDIFDKKAEYSVYTVDIDGYKSPSGIPYSCLAGKADNEAPVIIVTSPITSIPRGQNLPVKFSVVENRIPDEISATLFYRASGNKAWKEIPFQHRARASFGVSLNAGEITSKGIEYYIRVSDGQNTSVYPVLAPAINQTVVVTAQPERSIAIPQVKESLHKISWNSLVDADMYRIYRSKNAEFDCDPVSFLTFVSGKTNVFRDNGFDFDGLPLKGSYYYKIKAVDCFDNESDASETICIKYE